MQTEMVLQNVHNQEMGLVLSSDAKPRLKWTAELHQRFIDAVNQLGGAEKATPKSLMRIMGIHGLTLYHLKSHLQKYRLGRSQQSHHNKQEDNGENQISQLTSKIHDGIPKQIDESLQVAHALQMQMEVQRELHEQMEVQRHLQLRIEAQGKYLQSVLKKAQDNLWGGYSACSIEEVERAKAQLSQLVTMVNSGCTTSSFSVLTESDGPVLKDTREMLLEHNRYSLESSLTSSESSGRKGDAQLKHEVGKKRKRDSVMEMKPMIASELESNNDIDLNCSPLNEFFDSCPKGIHLKGIDLNSNDDGL